MSRMVSPNDIQKAAQDHMLEGREPETRDDWVRCVNFWAANVQKGLEGPTCKLMALIFQVPLDPSEIDEVAKFQAERK